MFVSIATPEYTGMKANSLKVRAALTSGVLEVYEKHQDLIGKINNNFLEIEHLVENKVVSSCYVLQDAIFIVSNEGLDFSKTTKETSVYVYAKKSVEISKGFSLDQLMKDIEEKRKNLATEVQALKLENDQNNFELLSVKAFILKEDIVFLEKVYEVAKSKGKN